MVDKKSRLAKTKIIADDASKLLKMITPIYEAFFNEIFEVRSYYSIKNFGNPTISVANIDSLRSKAAKDVSNEQQESYCNAFYRLVGLPIYDGAGLYSSGYEPQINGKEYFNQKFNITNNAISKVGTFLLNRETNHKNRDGAIRGESIDSIKHANALSSMRTLNILKNYPNDFLSGNEISSADKNRQSLFDQVYAPEAKGKIPLPGSGFEHTITPFMPDPRIDLMVFPVRNLIAAPFLTKSQRKISSDTTLRKSLIEKICFVRFSNNFLNNSSVSSEDLQKLVDKIHSSNTISDDDLFKAISGAALASRAPSSIAFNLFFLLQNTLDVLFASNKVIQLVNREMNWVPVPDSNGMLGDVGFRDIISGDPNNKDLENRIINLNTHKAIAERTVQALQQSTPQDDYAFASADSYIFRSITDDIAKSVESALDSLVNKRKKLGQDASIALTIVDRIMGDSIGLGLIDVIIMNIALWELQDSELLGLLDPAAQIRMNAAISPKSLVAAAIPAAAMSALLAKIKDLYERANKYYENNLATTK
jgi:hypothetical protein